LNLSLRNSCHHLLTLVICFKFSRREKFKRSKGKILNLHGIAQFFPSCSTLCGIHSTQHFHITQPNQTGLHNIQTVSEHMFPTVCRKHLELSVGFLGFDFDLNNKQSEKINNKYFCKKEGRVINICYTFCLIVSFPIHKAIITCNPAHQWVMLLICVQHAIFKPYISSPCKYGHICTVMKYGLENI